MRLGAQEAPPPQRRLAREFGAAMTIDDYGEAIGLPSGSAVRASLGLASDFADINRFSAFASEFVDLNTPKPNRIPFGMFSVLARRMLA
jgi:hypothetical protein